MKTTTAINTHTHTSIGALNSFYFPHLSSFFTQNYVSHTAIARQFFCCSVLFYGSLIFLHILLNSSGSSLHTNIQTLLYWSCISFPCSGWIGIFHADRLIDRYLIIILPIYTLLHVYFNCNLVQPYICCCYCWYRRRETLFLILFLKVTSLKT